MVVMSESFSSSPFNIISNRNEKMEIEKYNQFKDRIILFLFIPSFKNVAK